MSQSTNHEAQVLPTASILVEALSHLRARQQTFPDRFRIHTITQPELCKLLTESYRVEVLRRHREPCMDAETLGKIHRLSVLLSADNASPKFGAMICGTCGNGKTTLILALQNAINYLSAIGRLHAWRDDKGFSLGLRIIDAKQVASLMTNAEAADKLRKYPLLAVEDIGREPAEVQVYGTICTPLIDLLEYRYANQLTTIITSNLSPRDIRAKYGDRIGDRCNEMFEIIEFHHQSYRNSLNE